MTSGFIHNWGSTKGHLTEKGLQMRKFMFSYCLIYYNYGVLRVLTIWEFFFNPIIVGCCEKVVLSSWKFYG
jgi:hypothetical protein